MLVRSKEKGITQKTSKSINGAITLPVINILRFLGEYSILLVEFLVIYKCVSTRTWYFPVLAHVFTRLPAPPASPTEPAYCPVSVSLDNGVAIGKLISVEVHQLPLLTH